MGDLVSQVLGPKDQISKGSLLEQVMTGVTHAQVLQQIVDVTEFGSERRAPHFLFVLLIERNHPPDRTGRPVCSCQVLAHLQTNLVDQRQKQFRLTSPQHVLHSRSAVAPSQKGGMHFKPVLRSVDESAAGPEPSQVFGRLLADRIRPSDLIYAFNHIIDRPSDVRLLQTFPVVDQACS